MGGGSDGAYPYKGYTDSVLEDGHVDEDARTDSQAFRRGWTGNTWKMYLAAHCLGSST
ncbi:hypothetical protein BDN67DRAFT_961512 [Paxillus ammoniavirescens]|nr:hypothetical protein BDN67DRAFT_961512 [Paxillus ammoniavirescens]